MVADMLDTLLDQVVVRFVPAVEFGLEVELRLRAVVDQVGRHSIHFVRVAAVRNIRSADGVLVHILPDLVGVVRSPEVEVHTLPGPAVVVHILPGPEVVARILPGLGAVVRNPPAPGGGSRLPVYLPAVHREEGSILL
mmetsp:Transcript_26548/g.103393  ORF Transcript_26548/g.103393 Transcript_26548/m.103393 type:complete len:138 (+) Transcript_26548:467-880(+)